MIILQSRGDFRKTSNFLRKSLSKDIYKSLDKYGREGVVALSSATPVESGLAANSWSYEIVHDGRSASITWLNHDLESGFPVAIMLQYGYATGTGGYVQGRDYINPAIRPIFDRISDSVWKEVTSA